MYEKQKLNIEIRNTSGPFPRERCRQCRDLKTTLPNEHGMRRFYFIEDVAVILLRLQPTDYDTTDPTDLFLASCYRSLPLALLEAKMSRKPQSTQAATIERPPTGQRCGDARRRSSDDRSI